MKTNKLILCILLLTGTTFLYSQSPKEIILVSYIHTSLSPNMVSILKKQVPDPDQYQQAINVIQQHKVFYSLYLNTKTRESVFVLDSIQSHPHVSSPGQTNYVYTNSEGLMKGSESFMESNVFFNNYLKDIEWELTENTKEISDFKCQEATIKGNPDISVWFTNEISTNKGPSYFQGLFGLVLEASDFFGTISVSKVEYINDNQIIKETIMEKVNKNKGKYLSLNELLALKQNMIRTLSVD